MTDRNKFFTLGITDECLFDIKELSGKYMLCLREMAVYEILPTQKCIVKGLYQSLLAGRFHKA